MPLSSQITEGQSLCLHCEAGRDLCSGDASSVWIQPVLLGIAGFKASTLTPKRCRAGEDVNHCRPQWQTSVLLAQMLQTPLLRALPAHLPASRKKISTKFPPACLGCQPCTGSCCSTTEPALLRGWLTSSRALRAGNGEPAPPAMPPLGLLQPV